MNIKIKQKWGLLFLIFVTIVYIIIFFALNRKPDSDVVESELFGYEKGSFTGANSNKPGLFEIANHGTLFLDEAAELPLPAQVKLLRVIQDGEIEKIGRTRENYCGCQNYRRFK
jgi:DNA-binding NtrC family response regulator